MVQLSPIPDITIVKSISTILSERSDSVRTIRAENQEYALKDGRKVHLLAEGRLVNLAAAEGHPSEVMDMSFANQFLSLCRLAAEGSEMDSEVYDITLGTRHGTCNNKTQDSRILN